MSTPAAILLLVIAAWLVSMTFFGGLAHRLAGAV